MAIKRIDYNRSNPIQDTITTIDGYPNKLIIFKVPASKYWWCRCYFNKRYYKQSTSTENKNQAKSFAINFYEKTILSTRNLIPKTPNITFENIARDYLQKNESAITTNALQEKRKNRQYREDYNKFIADIFPALGQRLLRSIVYSDIQSYINDISKRKLSASTLTQHIVLIRKVFKHAQRENLIQFIPPFPTIKVQDNPRTWFSFNEYNHLKKTTNELIKKKEIVRGHLLDDEMRFLITFNVNTFLRISDIKELKHRHIDVNDGKVKYLLIQPEISKTKYNSPVTSMPDAVGIYKDILEYHKTHNNPYTKNDYVFFPKIHNRQFALDTMRRLFNRILEVAQLKINSSGDERTLYSLRHSSISFRLIRSDVDMLTLAKNARTSVEMLERFYTSAVTSSDTIKKIQSNRKD